MITLNKNGRTYIIKSKYYIEFPRIEYTARTAVVSIINTDSTVSSENINMHISVYKEGALIKEIESTCEDIYLSDSLIQGETYNVRFQLMSFRKNGITMDVTSHELIRTISIVYNKNNIYNYTYEYDSETDSYSVTAKAGCSYSHIDEYGTLKADFPDEYSGKLTYTTQTSAISEINQLIGSNSATSLDLTGFKISANSFRVTGLDYIVDSTGSSGNFSQNGNYTTLYMPGMTSYIPMNNLGTIFVPSSMKENFLENFDLSMSFAYGSTSGWTTLANGRKLRYFPFIYMDNSYYTAGYGGHIWPPRIPSKFRFKLGNYETSALFMPAELTSLYPNSDYPREYGPFDDTYIKKDDIIKAIKAGDSDMPFSGKPRYVHVVVPEYECDGVTISESVYNYIEFPVHESVIGLAISYGSTSYGTPDGGTRCYIPSPLVYRKKIGDEIVIGIPCRTFQNVSFSSDDIRTFPQVGYLDGLVNEGFYIYPITPRGIQAITGYYNGRYPLGVESDDELLRRRYSFKVNGNYIMSDEPMYPISIQRSDVIFEKPEIKSTSYGGK